MFHILEIIGLILSFSTDLNCTTMVHFIEWHFITSNVEGLLAGTLRSDYSELVNRVTALSILFLYNNTIGILCMALLKPKEKLTHWTGHEKISFY